MKEWEERKKLIKEVGSEKNEEEEDKEFKWIVYFEKKEVTRVLSAKQRPKPFCQRKYR